MGKSYRHRSVDSEPREQALGNRLVEGQSAGITHGTDEGNPEGFEYIAQGAVLTGGSMQQRDHAGRRISPEPIEQGGVDVGFRYLELRRGNAKCLGDPTTRAQGDVAFSRQTPGKYDDASAQRMLGAGLTEPSESSSTAPVPKVCAISSSDSITPARRRTPSRMRSGSG